MIVVSGLFEIDPSDRERALEMAKAVTAGTLEEPGCRTYGFWADPDDPGRFRVFEEWESQEALDAHFTTPHLVEFITGIASLAVRSTDVQRYDVSAQSKLM